MPPPLDPVTVRYARAGAYEVHFDRLASLPAHAQRAGLRPASALVVTDDNVEPLHMPAVRAALESAGWRVTAHTVPAGESSKSAAVLEALYGAAHAAGLERRDAVVALGGGVVGDLAGFAAATWLRGVPLIQVPTTVLSQCDSSIGGKTGINHAGGKNMVGALWPPRLVLSDVSTLATLPDAEFRAGLSEVVKHAILEGPAAVDELAGQWRDLEVRDEGTVASVLRRAAAFKAALVSEDEQEAGPRAQLNLGHTFAHAIESASGMGVHSHGQAVALGLRAALHLSASLAAGRPLPADGALPPPFDRPDALAARLPTGPTLTAPTPALERALAFDKKRLSGSLRFVVVDAAGRPRLADAVPAPMIAAAWARARLCSRD